MKPQLILCVIAGVLLIACPQNPQAGDVTELHRLRSLTDEQLSEEMQQRGLSPAQAKQAARVLRQQLGPRPAKNETSASVLVELPEAATADFLKKIPDTEAQVVSVYSDARNVERFSLMNGTVQNFAIHRAGGSKLGTKASDFAVYGVTADGHLFKTMLHAPVLFNAPGRGLNLKMFAVERKHLPLTVYLHRESGEEQKPSTGDAEAPRPLIDFLDQEAELILEVTGEKSPPGKMLPGVATAPCFVVSWDTRLGYVFVPSTTRQPAIGRTLKW